MPKNTKDKSLDSNDIDADPTNLLDEDSDMHYPEPPVGQTSDIRRRIDDLLEKKRLRDEFGELDDLDF